MITTKCLADKDIKSTVVISEKGKLLEFSEDLYCRVRKHEADLGTLYEFGCLLKMSNRTNTQSSEQKLNYKEPNKIKLKFAKIVCLGWEYVDIINSSCREKKLEFEVELLVENIKCTK